MATGLCPRFLCRFLLLFLLFSSIASYAQYNGNIHDVVFGPGGAAINGASVVLRNVDTGVSLPRGRGIPPLEE